MTGHRIDVSSTFEGTCQVVFYNIDMIYYYSQQCIGVPVPTSEHFGFKLYLTIINTVTAMLRVRRYRKKSLGLRFLG